MIETWITHFTGTVEGRPVSVLTYSEGGYRVSTTQGADHGGDVFGDESNTVIISPTAKGMPIDIDDETLDGVREQLVIEQFSESAIEEIIGHFLT